MFTYSVPDGTINNNNCKSAHSFPRIIKIFEAGKRLLSDIMFHQGRTDLSGGHTDLFNRSGLGFYHYHHGQPPHLHPNGICPNGSVTTSIVNPYTGKTVDLGISYTFNNQAYYSLNLVSKALTADDSIGVTSLTNEGGAFYACPAGNSSKIYQDDDKKLLFTYPKDFLGRPRNNALFATDCGSLQLLCHRRKAEIDDKYCYAYVSLEAIRKYMSKDGYFFGFSSDNEGCWRFVVISPSLAIMSPLDGAILKANTMLSVVAYIKNVASARLEVWNPTWFSTELKLDLENESNVTFTEMLIRDEHVKAGELTISVEADVGGTAIRTNVVKTIKVRVEESGSYMERYPMKFIEFIKSYETHKMQNGRFVLDNQGQTIGYGHDVLLGEDFSDGLSVEEALGLLIKDLNSKWDSASRYVNALNTNFGYNINMSDFSENEHMFLVDFMFNRGAGLFKRPELEASVEPFSSIAILIVAVLEKDDKKIIATLMEETMNTEGVYYEGLKLRRMDEYEILKFGDYVRDYDVNRDFTKPKG